MKKIFILILIIVMNLVGCSSSTNYDDGVHKVKLVNLDDPTTLRIGVYQDANNLNPHMTTASVDTFIIGFIYDNLFSYDEVENEYHPRLAHSFRISDDLSYIEVDIYKNMTWSDGEPVTVDDVVFTFHYLIEKRIPRGFGILRTFDRAEKISDETVRFYLKSPDLSSLRLFTTAMPILPKHIWENISNPIDEPNLNPVGSGPFVLVEKNDGQNMVLVRRADYPDTYHIDKIVLHVIKDQTVSVMSLMNNDFDMLLSSVDASIADDIKNNPERYNNISVSETYSLSNQTMMFNLRREPFDNVNVRKAIALAIDRQEIIEQVLFGYGYNPNPGLIMEDMGYCNKELEPIKRSLSQANNLLDNEGILDTDNDGYREVNGEKFTIELSGSNMAPYTVVAQYIVKQLQEVGIEVTYNPLAPDALSNIRKTADFDVMFQHMGFSSYPDMMFYYYHSSRGEMRDNGNVSGFNYGGYNDAAMDQKLEEMFGETNLERKVELYKELQSDISSTYYHVPIYATSILHLYRDDNLTGWQTIPGSGIVSEENFKNLKR